ncbi:DEAD/DEAH box helicase family protein [Hellea sp.]|nr:DEAD/DEAH box helicase family protein [Hellea sp.]
MSEPENTFAQPPALTTNFAANGASTTSNAMGMRAMQARAWQYRGEQYLLIKSPPASGKSRALMFVALDKLRNQDVRKAIIVVPERSIGASFANEPLSKFGFFTDWEVEPQWNLTNAAGADDANVPKSTIKAVAAFLESDAEVLVTTHSTFRHAANDIGIEPFDNCLIAIDEFHHVSADKDNVLGSQLGALLDRDQAHVVAMTGSYFRGDSVPVLSPEDEARFETVTYTYYEQLNGYEYLKTLDIGYSFYHGDYIEAVPQAFIDDMKTIIHIPNVNAREAGRYDKYRSAEMIMEHLGEWKGRDPETGFILRERSDGKILRVANLVDDDPNLRAQVVASLKDTSQKMNRDWVDVIIALGMAKEGFDWVWCEHALTIGYRASLTEVVQIIGRATRDAEGKTNARFTNLIAEPDAAEDTVVDAVNDTLKAIAASLLMEQVLAPRFNFTPRDVGPQPGFDYDGGYKEGENNIGYDGKGAVHVEINGLAEPKSSEGKRIVEEDLNDLVASFLQDKRTMERGLFDDDVIAEELTQVAMGQIVRTRYPEVAEADQEAIRMQAVAAINLIQKGKEQAASSDDGESVSANTALLDGIRKYAMDVRDLDIDLIDSINPFKTAYNIMSKAMDQNTLLRVKEAISAKRVKFTPEEAMDFALRARRFNREHNRLPEITSQDPWEQKIAEGVVAFKRFKAEGKYE